MVIMTNVPNGSEDQIIVKETRLLSQMVVKTRLLLRNQIIVKENVPNGSEDQIIVKETVSK